MKHKSVSLWFVFIIATLLALIHISALLIHVSNFISNNAIWLLLFRQDCFSSTYVGTFLFDFVIFIAILISRVDIHENYFPSIGYIHGVSIREKVRDDNLTPISNETLKGLHLHGLIYYKYALIAYMVYSGLVSFSLFNGLLLSCILFAQIGFSFYNLLFFINWYDRLKCGKKGGGIQ